MPRVPVSAWISASPSSASYQLAADLKQLVSTCSASSDPTPSGCERSSSSLVTAPSTTASCSRSMRPRSSSASVNAAASPARAADTAASTASAISLAGPGQERYPAVTGLAPEASPVVSGTVPMLARRPDTRDVARIPGAPGLGAQVPEDGQDAAVLGGR